MNMKKSYLLILAFLIPIFLSSLIPQINTVKANVFNPLQVYSSYNVNNANYSIVEDANQATINSNGYIIFLIGNTGQNITLINIKDVFTSSTARIEIYVSNDGISWFMIADNYYRSGASLTWKRFPINDNQHSIEYIKIINTCPTTSYYNIDSISLDTATKVFIYLNYNYPKDHLGHTLTVIDGITTLCGYYANIGIPYVINPRLILNNDYIIYDLGLSFDVTSVYIEATQITGTNNLHVYLSWDYITWTDLGLCGLTNYNYTVSHVSTRYIKLMLSSTGDHDVYSVSVRGASINNYFVPIPSSIIPFDYYTLMFSLAIPLCILTIPMGILAKYLGLGGAIVGLLLGVGIGFYFSLIPVYVVFLAILGVVVLLIFGRSQNA